MVSYCCPGRTFMLACSGRNDHGSFEFTPPSNCTVISRSDLRPSSAAARSPSTADFSNRTPNTFSQAMRSEEHTSELQSLMRTSYAVFCLKKKKTETSTQTKHN